MGPACRLVPVVVLIGFASSSTTVLAFTAAAALGLAWLTAVAARLLTNPADRDSRPPARAGNIDPTAPTIIRPDR